MSKPLENVLVVAAGTVGSLAIDKLKQDDNAVITVVAPRENDTIKALRPQDRWLTPDAFEHEKTQGMKPFGRVVFALKPQVLGDELEKYANVVDENTTIVLTAAGKDTTHADDHLAKGRNLNFVRIMVNTPMKVGRGVIAYYARPDIDQRHIDGTKALFSKTDLLYRVPQETHMHEATAATGSGPGFIFEYLRKRQGQGTDRKDVIDDFQVSINVVKARAEKNTAVNEQSVSKSVRQGIAFIDAYKQVVVELDFVTPDKADLITIEMMDGALELARQSPDSFETLRNKVTSKGGTTEAGLKAWASFDWDDSVEESDWDACRNDIVHCVHETVFAANEKSHALARPAV